MHILVGPSTAHEHDSELVFALVLARMRQQKRHIFSFAPSSVICLLGDRNFIY